MSTIKVNSFQDTSGRGFYPSRVWVNFNGTGTVAIRDDGGASSITDNTTGDYTTNFSNNFANANYSAVCTAGDGSNNSVWEHFSSRVSYATSSFRYGTGTTGGWNDCAYNNLHFTSD